MRHKQRIIGLMSGTSLDGLDICCADFWHEHNVYNYDIIATQSLPYSSEIQDKIHRGFTQPKAYLTQLGVELSQLWSNAVNLFIRKHGLQGSIDAIGSHGQTIFHRPDLGYTVQVGDHLLMSYLTQLPIYAEFRQADIVLGGQGAPLVPIGDLLLFHTYDFCLNIGGFSNLSIKQHSEIIAYDICPANFVLNLLSQRIGTPYDKGGQQAQSGHLIPKLFHQLNQHPFFALSPPKSLGREWVEQYILSELKTDYNTHDLLHTYTEHIAYQIGKALPDNASGLVTGGGAFNHYLIQRIKTYSNSDLDCSHHQLIEFKEALVFGFIAYLKRNHKPNILSSVTGASKDHSAGVLFQVS